MSLVMSFSRRLAILGITALTILSISPAANGFILSTRWSTTATDGGGLNLGDPTTITWSLVPDGTSVPAVANSNQDAPSDLIAAFDFAFGSGPGGNDLTQRPWFTYFEQAFDRWGELSGLSYAYEPNDDGVDNFGARGILGVRGDVRIGGSNQDGPNRVLAFNAFPNGGDMSLDTGDLANFSQPANNFRFLRNTLMHEHGHGIGISHIESDNARFLMEPFIDEIFDGPQLDDIRAAHRGYGDIFEKANNGAGNDVIGNAIDLGVSATGSPIVIGTNGSRTRVLPTQVDFVSIDQNTDTDFWAFTVDNPGTLDVELMPQGATFLQGAQNEQQSSFNTVTTSDLTLALFDSSQNLVMTANNTGAGSIEAINAFDIQSAGEYYVRITGTANNVQLYQLSVDFEDAMPAVDIDFDDDGLVDCADIDALVADIAAGNNSPEFDLSGDSLVDGADLGFWLIGAGEENLASGNSYQIGDANLDGVVDGSDFNIWNQNKFTANPAWCHGDFTADGFVDGSDFNAWNANKFTSADQVTAVPEPASGVLLVLAGLAAFPFRRRR